MAPVNLASRFWEANHVALMLDEPEGFDGTGHPESATIPVVTFFWNFPNKSGSQSLQQNQADECGP